MLDLTSPPISRVLSRQPAVGGSQCTTKEESAECQCAPRSLLATGRQLDQTDALFPALILPIAPLLSSGPSQFAPESR